ncbi:MAG: GGDEF domain-containing protein [Acidimicrobiales bacterium]|nr:GGDEF domain-containing protein [Acidimicrobiales bacterium]
MLAAVVDLAGPVESDRRAQLFRIDGDSVEIAAERDETGRRALGLRFALADHDDLATAVRERTARLEGTHVYVPLLVDGALYGVLGATSRRGLAQANRVTRIATIGNIGALALANALVHERLVDENASLQEVSERDALTGLPNRRAWEGWIGGLGAEGADGGCPLDVGIIDLDHFKAFNDTHGHGAGDELLRAAAEGWVGVLRRGDLLARIGGEEFAFLVLDAPTGVAAQLAERLRASMPPGSTCSIGLARRRPGEPITAAMARADVALYRAKGAGRDRIEVADA